MSTNKQATSFRLSPGTREAIQQIAKGLNCSQAQVVETAITIYNSALTQMWEEATAQTKQHDTPKGGEA